MNKIVITVNTTWNIYNFRLGLITKLQEEGYEVHAISPRDQYVVLLEKLDIVHHHINIKQDGTNPLSDIQTIIEYRKIFKKIRPDIILSYTIKPNIYSTIAAYSLKIPVINNISGLGTVFIKKSIYTYIARLLYRISLRSSSHTFFQNSDDAKTFLELKLINESRTSLIPGSGVNTDKFNTSRNENKGNHFLFVGRLIKDKGIREYLEAAKYIISKHKNVKFSIIGELGYNNKTSIQKSFLDSYTDSTSQIEYLGKTDDIVSTLKTIDVLILPSYREGLSKSLLEACSMSLPIIATNVPGCREVTKDGVNGLLCEAKDVQSLAYAINEMIQFSEEKRLSMGQNGRNMVIANFSEQIVIKKYIEKIKEIIA